MTSTSDLLTALPGDITARLATLHTEAAALDESTRRSLAHLTLRIEEEIARAQVPACERPSVAGTSLRYQQEHTDTLWRHAHQYAVALVGWLIPHRAALPALWEAVGAYLATVLERVEGSGRRWTCRSLWRGEPWPHSFSHWFARRIHSHNHHLARSLR